MDDVYGFAYITIFAFGATNCQGGILTNTRYPPLLMKQSTRHRQFAEEPLNGRSWAFQEWHLSSRRLLFTSRGVLFDCFQGPKVYYGHLVYSYRLSSTAKPSVHDWAFFIMGQCSRNVTDPVDKLPSIAGLAQKFAAICNASCGRYLAGLWEGGLPAALIWHRGRLNSSFLSSSREGRPAAYRALSWS